MCPPEEEIQSIKMNPKNYSSFFIFTKGKIYYMQFSDFFNNVKSTNLSFTNMNNNNINSLKASFPEPILDSDIPITTSTLTNKNLLIGFEDGKIHVYSYSNILNFNRLTPLKANIIFSNHKGAITNIVCANRPISQYGLNFNNKIEEIIVRALKKPSIPYTDIIPVKQGINTENYFDNLVKYNLNDSQYNFIGEINSDYSNTNLNSNSLSNSNNNKTNEKYNKNLPLTKEQKIDNNAFNFEDPKFLKKKLAEVSEIMKNY